MRNKNTGYGVAFFNTSCYSVAQVGLWGLAGWGQNGNRGLRGFTKRHILAIVRIPERR